VVGGCTAACTEMGRLFYAQALEKVVPVSSTQVAEMVKLLENTFRMINIGLVNEVAMMCDRIGINVWEVIDAAATKPFGFMRFTPGPGVGGHCIPVDPYYLSWRAREFDFVDRFIELAGDINLAMPRHVVDLVGEALNDRGRALKGARVGVIGVAFKPNVRDPRNSPAADVIAGLRARGAEVSFHDPHVVSFRASDGVETGSTALPELLAASDVVVVITAHAAIDWDAVYAKASLVVDTTDSSRGRAVGSRQVLRLGAGWAVRA
jgi:UDP-N-acetyl-D-glucosamine dehydrogenase